VDVEEAIRTRRTHKVYGAEPVPRETLDELFELARWAPNHNLTNPWRFRVLGPDSLARLKEAAGEEAAAKLDRAPTLVVVSPATGARRPCCAPRRAARPRGSRTASAPSASSTSARAGRRRSLLSGLRPETS
jgi:nitroreductase